MRCWLTDDKHSLTNVFKCNKRIQSKFDVDCQFRRYLSVGRFERGLPPQMMVVCRLSCAFSYSFHRFSSILEILHSLHCEAFFVPKYQRLFPSLSDVFWGRLYIGASALPHSSCLSTVQSRKLSLGGNLLASDGHDPPNRTVRRWWGPQHWHSRLVALLPHQALHLCGSPNVTTIPQPLRTGSICLCIRLDPSFNFEVRWVSCSYSAVLLR